MLKAKDIRKDKIKNNVIRRKKGERKVHQKLEWTGISAQLFTVMKKGTKLAEHQLRELYLLEKSYSTAKYFGEGDKVLQFNM